MIHRYTPEVLGGLLAFKVSDELIPRKDLLALLLDGQRDCDQDTVERILFEGKTTSVSRSKRLKIIRKAVDELFTWTYHKFENRDVDAERDLDDGAWLLEVRSCDGLDASVLNSIEKRRKGVIREIKKTHRTLQKGTGAASYTMQRRKDKDNSNDKECGGPSKSAVSSTDLPSCSRERGFRNEKCTSHHGETGSLHDLKKKAQEAKVQDTTLLKFRMQCQRKERQEHLECKFLPVFSPEAFKPQDTVRKREDLVNPRKVTYIKFFERIKPSTYAVVKEKLFIRNSLKRIPRVLDYEYDSDLEWEDCDDAEDVESTDESEDADEEDDEDDDIDFVDTESETSLDRRFRPLELSFPKLDVTIFYDHKSNLNASLLKHESVPDFLMLKLEMGVKECLDIKAFSAEFASQHNIKLRAVQKKIQEMLPTAAP